MPWKECHVEDERLRFVARRLDGEKMAALCAEFGISRKTGYKICDRYKDYGIHELTDRSRRPYRHANQLPLVLETQIVRLKRDYPDWGAPKIREKLRGRCGPPTVPRHQHGARRSRSPWPGAVSRAAPAPRRRHRALPTPPPPMPLVRRLQRGVSPR